MLRFIYLLLIFISPCTWAEIVWLDKNWNLVESEEQASFYIKMPLVEQNNLWPVTVYYQGGRVTKVKGTFDSPDIETAILVGYRQYYSPTGKRASEGNYNHDGKAEGILRFYDEDGRLESEQNFINGTVQGVRRYFYPDGNLERECDLDAGYSGKCTFYYPTGEIREIRLIVDNKIQGERLVYYPSGVIKEKEEYRAGQRYGLSQRFYEKGQLSSQHSYKNDKLDGVVASYHNNGSKYVEQVYLDGIRNGHQRIWNEQGQLTYEGNHVGGKLNGATISYYNDGKIKQQNNYVNGNEVGIQKSFFQEDKRLKEIEEFDEKGRKVFSQLFDEQGNIIVDYKATYPNDQKLSDRKYFENNKLVTIEQVDSAKDWYLFEKYNQQGTVIKRKETEKGKRNNLQVTMLYYEPLESESTHYQHGQRHGSYKREVIDGELIELGEYAFDKKVGRWQYNDHVNRTQTFQHYNQNSELDGEKKALNAKGKLIKLENYKDGQLHGKYESYTIHGRLQEKGVYVQGKRHGYWQIEQDLFVDPSLGEGTWIHYEKEEMDKVDELLYGGNAQVSYYLLNSSLWSGNYQHGKRVGKWQTLSKNGYELASGQYDEQGREQGAFYYFSKPGLLYKIVRYLDGELHGDSEFYIDGELSYTDHYQHGNWQGVTDSR